jgi:Ca2+-binding RTX toxin-like protein
VTHLATGRAIILVLILNFSMIISFTPENRADALVDIFKPTNVHVSATDGNVVKCEIQLPPLCRGTNEDDIIIGASLPETILGLDGNDNIQGNEGNDTVLGGKGNDIISGGSGFDRLFGEDGNDVITGDATLSLLSALVGNELAATNRFNELLLGVNSSAPPAFFASSISVLTTGMAFANGTKEPADIFASQINSTDIPLTNIQLFDGGKGDDYLIGSSANDLFIGGPGHDYFDCNEGLDRILDFNPKEDTANNNCEILE